MDTKTDLLRTVVNAIINEDDTTAKDAFKQYATLRARGIIEGTKEDAAPAVEAEPVVEAKADESAEAVANEILNSEKAE